MQFKEARLHRKWDVCGSSTGLQMFFLETFLGRTFGVQLLKRKLRCVSFRKNTEVEGREGRKAGITCEERLDFLLSSFKSLKEFTHVPQEVKWGGRRGAKAL